MTTRIQALDLSVDLLQVLLWQYNDADHLQGLLTRKQAWYDAEQSGFWTNWIADVFNLQTANDFGLAVWAIILGVPLVVSPAPDNSDKFGFGPDETTRVTEADAIRILDDGFTVRVLAGAQPPNDNLNFNNGNFASSVGGVGLTTEQKRLVLRLRYFQLVTRGAAPEVNEFLATVFGPGAVYVADSNKMAITYVFAAPLPSAVELVLTQYDLLPRPAAVRSNYVIQGEADGWGFGRFHENFDNGNFYIGP
jgi:hypothetical protein